MCVNTALKFENAFAFSSRFVVSVFSLLEGKKEEETIWGLGVG